MAPFLGPPPLPPIWRFSGSLIRRMPLIRNGSGWRGRGPPNTAPTVEGEGAGRARAASWSATGSTEAANKAPSPRRWSGQRTQMAKRG